jgi:c-di-AMP phosphodiesterase-like protein
MDLKKYKNILNNLQKEKNIDYYEEKYQKLISKYSNAYLLGSKWYVGDSFSKYIRTKSLNQLYDPKLEYLRDILLNE